MTDPRPADQLVLTSGRVVTPGGVGPGAVHVRDGRIRAVRGWRAPRGPGVVDVGDLVVLPGLVDSHVHVNEPGRTEWEGFATATSAAAAGGVTTLVDMPLNCLPPITDLAALESKRRAAAGKVAVDVAFWGGVVPGSVDHLQSLHEAGVRGFKAFLCDSGVPEYPHLDAGDLTAVLTKVAALGSTLIVHAEDPRICAEGLAAVAGSDPRRYDTWVRSRPPEAEVAAVRALVRGCRDTGARVHVLHVSASAAAEEVARAKAEGLPVTAETCPHYLTLAAEDTADGDTTRKCAPPIRERANQERLWELLADGAIDAVVSDHSPCPPADKLLDRGDVMAAWGGIASLELGLPVMWTAAAARGLAITDLAEWMATAPAAVAGLAGKGAIIEGGAADLVVFDPDAEWVVDAGNLRQRHPVTPYAGARLTGRVVRTYLAGVAIAEDGHPTTQPSGELLP